MGRWFLLSTRMPVFAVVSLAEEGEENCVGFIMVVVVVEVVLISLEFHKVMESLLCALLWWLGVCFCQEVSFLCD